MADEQPRRWSAAQVGLVKRIDLLSLLCWHGIMLIGNLPQPPAQVYARVAPPCPSGSVPSAARCSRARMIHAGTPGIGCAAMNVYMQLVTVQAAMNGIVDAQGMQRRGGCFMSTARPCT